MKLVAGLGNPGAAYQGSRHNAGYRVADLLAQRAHAGFRESSRFRAALAKGDLAGVPVVMMKPLTFMNASGEAVGAWMRWHRLDVSDLVVVYDDADLEPGRLRVRPRGGSGGHKGVESVILHTGSDAFARVRVGVGHGDGNVDMVTHVLRPLAGEEEEAAERAAERAADAVEMLLAQGVTEAMNRFNGAPGGGVEKKAQEQE